MPKADFGGAVDDYEQVLRLSGDEAITRDLKRVRTLKQCSDLKVCGCSLEPKRGRVTCGITVQKAGDASLAAGSLEEALETYGQVLTIEPTFVSAISNRAACHLTMQR